jgi:glutamyl-tRNA synthetase
VFDQQKLEWMNGVYLRDATLLAEERLIEAFAQRLEAHLPADVPRPVDRKLVRALLPLVRERIKTLAELPSMVDFFFTGDIAAPTREALLGRPYRNDPEAARRGIEGARSFLAAAPEWDAPAIESALRAAAEELGQKPGDVFMLCRVAATGRAVTPPLFETMALVGRERCLERIDAARALLEG